MPNDEVMITAEQLARINAEHEAARADPNDPHGRYESVGMENVANKYATRAVSMLLHHERIVHGLSEEEMLDLHESDPGVPSMIRDMFAP